MYALKTLSEIALIKPTTLLSCNAKTTKVLWLIILCSDVVPDGLDQVMQFKEKEAKELYKFSTDDIPNLGAGNSTVTSGN